MGVFRDCPNFLGTHSQEWVKYELNFMGTFIGLIGTKVH